MQWIQPKPNLKNERWEVVYDGYPDYPIYINFSFETETEAWRFYEDNKDDLDFYEDDHYEQDGDEGTPVDDSPIKVH